MNEAIIISGYVPGAIGRITELQATYYAAHWGLGLYFEAKAAREMAEFFSRLQPNHDGAWLAQVDDLIVGSIFIDGSDADGEGARLRWFMIDPAYQRRGLGRRLMEAAMPFCNRQGFKRVYLTTFAGLDTARHLYEAYGFTLCSETDGAHLTGTSSLVEQVFEYFPDANLSTKSL
jgi:GNAT superfamily N-acetyltransferase